MRRCAWCRGAIADGKRRDAITCSKSCRQARHRLLRQGVSRARATDPLRLAYADPPYPGLAGYYRDRPDFGGEVDHAELLSRLQAFDGWALSTSARALPAVLAECVAQGLPVRVACWVRGVRPHQAAAWPLSGWEPVVFAGGRQDPSRGSRADTLTHAARPRLADPHRVLGAKPAAFIWWMFELLGALPGDELVDLFPGSGRVGDCWRAYVSRSSTDTTDRREAA